ncbi:SnoaL-like domain-containing protein [Frankia sp. AiPs1]|uniref:nuclear transport factor 2 family protein n=1 Tax=Frankia sp. AiPa1 TaxID=573492 RepID=UPI00202B4CDE|nr:nuclear transport factor 2 family protein [Frankia sp. AiPa1]MCL9762827.1 nuclear transport factor 2 family protein [Frankia sp. AiPa1]
MGHTVTATLSAADLAEIGQTLALFAHVCDNWREISGRQDGGQPDDRPPDALELVFTEDVRFEFARSGRVLDGLAEIRAFLRGIGPDAADHQTVNTVVLVDVDGTVRALSRYLAILADGSVTNGEYEDVLVRAEPGGWRIRSRRSVHRYPRASQEAPLPRGEAWRPSADRLPSLFS